MKKYSSKGLAQLIRAIIDKYYTDPKYVYANLKQNINGKVKANNHKDLTVDELEEKGLLYAKYIIENINRISIEYIENKLSVEIVNEASQGIEIGDYSEYLLKSAKKRVQEFANHLYKVDKSKSRKSRKKK